MPHRTTRSVRSPVIGPPSNVISPAEGVKNPMIAFSTVLLPAPFGPMMLTTSPG